MAQNETDKPEIIYDDNGDIIYDRPTLLEAFRAAQNKAERYEQKATRDPLTELLNRAGAQEAFDKAVALYKRLDEKPEFAYFLLLDLDHFKQVNDRFGHQMGDRVLQHVAEIITASIRDGDSACRFGGEELVIFGFGHSEDGAKILAENVRKAIKESRLENHPEDLKITASVGAMAVAFTDLIGPLSHYIDLVDPAVYAAKRAGRNRVVTIDFPKMPRNLPSPIKLAEYNKNEPS